MIAALVAVLTAPLALIVFAFIAALYLVTPVTDLLLRASEFLLPTPDALRGGDDDE